MSLIALKCPSCGAKISLSDDEEYGYCTYCGSKIQNEAIQRLKIEYRGDPMSVTNVKNERNAQYIFNVENKQAVQPNITISKPRFRRLVFGILFVAVVFICICVFIDDKRIESAGLIIAGVFGSIGIALIISYIRSASLYAKAVKNAINNGTVTNR